MRRMIIAVTLVGMTLLISNSCAPASKSWVMEYTNGRINPLYSELTTRISSISDSLKMLNDSLKALNDSLSVISQKVQELSDSISAIASLSAKVDMLQTHIDTLDAAVDSVKHFQRQLVPAYLKTLRDIIDQYIQSTQDTL